MTSSKKKTADARSGGAGAPVIDPYVPASGNFGYRVSRYELDLEYKVAINRLAGTATIIAVTLAALRTFTLDLTDTLSATKVTVNDARPQRFRSSAGKLHIALRDTLPAGAAMTIVVRYGGVPRPIRSLWGDIGFEELTDGALVAGQPNGAPSWFPCDDHPSAKASFRIQITTESPYRAIANGELMSRRARAGMTTWTYELPEPTSTYLVTVQIGMYERHRMAENGVPIDAVLPDRLRRDFEHDFARQPQMMKLFVKLFGAYPLSEGYTVVVTDDDLEIPLEAQGISIFGANHCDGGRGAERLIAHELAHQWFGNSVTAKRWRHIWLHEGFACYAEWLWSENSGGRSAEDWAHHYHQRLAHSPQDLVLADPGPRDMFDDRVYKRGALTLHVLRRHLGDDNFFALLQDWTARYRHSTVVTDDFTALASHYASESLRPLWDCWLYSTDLPALDPP
ncbi:M1 family metallopeptidase [Mycolicibacterium celeriflavum]|uniref:Aminopeptidase N n=1 Tax=Mycolicibacterium celeriflavum TaxID=1249101 RepID=A0A1X0BR02_MYCCF|nr:M1 family metallopeptidase [Mycolicibacterium celeriflavum]MCV7238050.1 M1 family metallopeptidase [Mycolicibacterium celeriflavum]ORA45858.1 peptidase M1 [Mycolicibacterium celeriflavum]BBY45413.1 peptidase M1 [Mycolicibacterium celeriflavum]